MNDQEYQDPRENLDKLIISLCTSGSTKLDDAQLKELKSICKSNDDCLSYAFEVLITQLKKDHSEIRHSAFQLIDCLFLRSHLFRELVLDQANRIFELVLETNLEDQLPAPRKAANLLKKLAAQSIKIWYDKFGKDYKLLELGFNYLKNCKKIDFVSFSHQSTAERALQEKKTEKQLFFINKRVSDCINELNENENDIVSCFEQLERSLGILMPLDDLFSLDDFNKKSQPQKSSTAGTQQDDSDSDDSDEDDFVEVRTSRTKDEIEEERNFEMRYFGIGENEDERDKNFLISVNLKENEDNKILLEISRGLYKELKNTHLSKVAHWIKNFGMVKTAAEPLKKAIDLKNKIQSVLKRFEDLKIPIVENKPEEKKVETVEPCCSKSVNNDKKPEPKILNEKDKKKQELLKIAPVVNLDEIEFFAPVVQKVEATCSLYQRREDEEGAQGTELLKDASRSLTKTTFIGKFEPVKWSCRAPLKSGKLCPRMDRFKCPIHGKIVARDEMGNIVNEKERLEVIANDKSEVPAWKDAELIADINAATGMNIQVNSDKKTNKKKRKISNLTDLSKEDEDTPRKRIQNRLFTAKNLNKVGNVLDSIERRQNHERFHHNFNYSIQS